MKHVHVGMVGSIFEINNINITKNGLVSLIAAFDQENFGESTYNKTIRLLNEYRNDIIKPSNSTQWIDSGGYSIIVGKVEYYKVGKVIKYYHKYLNNEFENYDKIFSLDIPFSIKHPELQNKINIKSENKLSIQKSIKAIKNNPLIRDKFYFIYHFKIKEQYEIWSELYNELDIKNYITHRAIGGLVGLKGSKHCPWINFTTFLHMTFKLLFDHVKSNNIVPVFKIHILGTYGRGERFCMTLLEKLFNNILEDYGTKVEITYDSINYIRSSQLKYKDIPIYHLINDKLIKYDPINIPKDLLKLIFPDQFIETNIKHPVITKFKDHLYIKLKLNKFDHMVSEIHRCIPVKNERLKNSSCFAPLNIFSNIEIDKLFDYVIDNHNIVDIVKKNQLSNKDIESLLTNIKSSYNYSDIFTGQLLNFIGGDLAEINKMYLWWNSTRDEKSLDQIITDQINRINFSVKLPVLDNKGKEVRNNLNKIIYTPRTKVVFT